MARSIRHKPILGNTCAESEKRDKVLAHRCARRVANQIVPIIVSDESIDLPHPRMYGDPWLCAKDGKRWRRNPQQKWMRK